MALLSDAPMSYYEDLSLLLDFGNFEALLLPETGRVPEILLEGAEERL